MVSQPVTRLVMSHGNITSHHPYNYISRDPFRTTDCHQNQNVHHKTITELLPFVYGTYTQGILTKPETKFGYNHTTHT